VTQTPSFSDVNLDGIQPPPPARNCRWPRLSQDGPPASEIAERPGSPTCATSAWRWRTRTRAAVLRAGLGLYRIADDGTWRFLSAVGSPEPFILRIRAAADSRRT